MTYRKEFGTARTFVAVFMVEKLVQLEKELVVRVDSLVTLSAVVGTVGVELLCYATTAITRAIRGHRIAERMLLHRV
jgi:hypothetical protein